MPDERTQVLIVGGGLVGLSMALFLRMHGVATMLVERHPGTAIHPRTPAYNPRTMELFRCAGVEKSVREADVWSTSNTGILWVETLAGKEMGWLDPPEMKGMTHDFSELSPTTWKICRQDRLEPVLRKRIEDLRCDVRFGTSVTSWESHADGVTAVLDDGRGARTVEADYLVAADGTSSAVREQLGIDLEGRGALDHRVSIWFRADLTEARRDRGIVLCVVRNPELSGTLRVTSDLCSLTVSYQPDLGEGPEDFDEQRCVDAIRAAIGIPDLEVDVGSVTPWALAAGVARRYREDRVLLAGDAAHTMPPAGAYGANTGIHDAHNLAWKLAMVLDGSADSVLLDSYEEERRPVAQLTVEQTVARWYEWYADNLEPAEPLPEMADDLAMIFGYRYRSSAVLPDDPSGAVEWVQPEDITGEPGLRLPHAWVTRDGERMSTIDLCGSSFVLLTGTGGTAWADAARQVASSLGVPLVSYRIGTGGDLVDQDVRWPRAFGVDDGGAVLVRPDAFVAWRSTTSDGEPAATLEGVLRGLLR